jgi:CheY-like chemotaxis protein
MLQALVIEDEGALRDLYSRMLENVGFIVEAVEDGQTAITYLNQSVPELILLDIRMPNSNGLDVILHLQENERFDNTHVVIISASKEFGRYTKMLPSAEYLQKPVLSLQLTEIANRVKQF